MSVHSLPTAEHIERAVADAVAHYWITRRRQQDKQESSGRTDQGFRGAVTGGAQMDGFIQLLTRIVADAGVQADCVFYRRALQLPGF